MDILRSLFRTVKRVAETILKGVDEMLAVAEYPEKNSDQEFALRPLPEVLTRKGVSILLLMLSVYLSAQPFANSATAHPMSITLKTIADSIWRNGV